MTPASLDVGADLRSDVLVVDGKGEQQPDAAAGAAEQDDRGNHAHQDDFLLFCHGNLLVGFWSAISIKTGSPAIKRSR